MAGRIVLALVILWVAACGDGEAAPEPAPAPRPGCAHVAAAAARAGADGTFSFDVTVRSADTGWDKYADAWEVVGPDGTVLGTRVLTHPHENEQPFTRSLQDVEIPAGVDEVSVRARDSVQGFCGTEQQVALPGR